ncbi:MAG: hypothetical protein ACE37H_15515 [Phycisphaeraceae bacterium]
MIAYLLRRKAAALTWQYLDGVIPPDRFELLQRLLRRHRVVRRQFVDCAVLNALLFAYFNPGRYAATPATDGRPRPIDFEPIDADRLDEELAQLAGHDEAGEPEARPRRTKRPAG